ncbi:MAG: outer membrane protein assembly factor BamE [Lactobacillales bacterium]|nr:outer membrane protein assembly factor BamE [Lactobacillales bacterium]
MFKRLLLSVCFSGCLFLGACGLEVYQNGDLPEQKRLDAVKPGQSKEQIMRMLGSPAFDGTALKDPSGKTPVNIFIYARIKKESQAFMDPKETDRQVYVVYFDSADKVIEMKHLTMADRNRPAYDRSTTPSGGQELSTWEQLSKNFGRYDAGGVDSTTRR